MGKRYKVRSGGKMENLTADQAVKEAKGNVIVVPENAVDMSIDGGKVEGVKDAGR